MHYWVVLIKERIIGVFSGSVAYSTKGVGPKLVRHRYKSHSDQGTCSLLGMRIDFLFFFIVFCGFYVWCTPLGVIQIRSDITTIVLLSVYYKPMSFALYVAHSALNNPHSPPLNVPHSTQSSLDILETPFHIPLNTFSDRRKIFTLTRKYFTSLFFRIGSWCGCVLYIPTQL